MKNKIRRNVRSSGLDRISDLPDNILTQILSLLPTEDSVGSSFLSKRWKSLWTSLPILDLDFNNFSKKYIRLCLDDRKKRFIEFSECVLFLHEIQHLKKLRLAFDITEFGSYASQIRTLIRLAMRSDCSTLDLDFSTTEESWISELKDTYSLPLCSFPHPSVTDLKLNKLKFVPSLYKSFVSIKSATLTRVELPEDSVYNLISQSPCLQELHLIECNLPIHLEFDAPESNIKVLVLKRCNIPLSCFSHFSANIPNLLRFKFSGMVMSLDSNLFTVKNSKYLIEANLNLRICTILDVYPILCDILKDFYNVKILTLSHFIIKKLSLSGRKCLQTPLCNLKHLKVNLGQDDEDLLGLTCFLRSAPYLATLSVKFHQFANCYEDENQRIIWNPNLISSDCVSHLNVVEIKDFEGRRSEMEFVKIMLKNSLCLKKMVIWKKGVRSRLESLMRRGNQDELNFLQRQYERAIENLLALTRASPDAQILLK